MAFYIHDLDPIALPIYGDFAIRWYGLAYLMGFLIGYFVLRQLAQRQLWILKPELVADFITACAMYGVFVGGRLGYVFFYQLPKTGFASLLHDPLMIFRVWEGGMASHGGILGLAIFTFLYARKHQLSWASLADGLCIAGPLGLFFGRMANFINGELYGRITESIPWAVKFPQSLGEESVTRQADAWQACTDIMPSLATANSLETLVDASRQNPELLQTLGRFLSPRHPSQLYEGLLEGLVLFVILLAVRIKLPKAAPGLITGLFFSLYAIFRIISEQYREPDAALVGIFTKGQFFSLFMFFFAIAFWIHAWRSKPESV